MSFPSLTQRSDGRAPGARVCAALRAACAANQWMFADVDGHTFVSHTGGNKRSELAAKSRNPA